MDYWGEISGFASLLVQPRRAYRAWMTGDRTPRLAALAGLVACVAQMVTVPDQPTLVFDSVLADTILILFVGVAGVVVAFYAARLFSGNHAAVLGVVAMSFLPSVLYFPVELAANGDLLVDLLYLVYDAWFVAGLIAEAQAVRLRRAFGAVAAGYGAVMGGFIGATFYSQQPFDDAVLAYDSPEVLALEQRLYAGELGMLDGLMAVNEIAGAGIALDVGTCARVLEETRLARRIAIVDGKHAGREFWIESPTSTPVQVLESASTTCADGTPVYQLSRFLVPGAFVDAGAVPSYELVAPVEWGEEANVPTFSTYELFADDRSWAPASWERLLAEGSIIEMPVGTPIEIIGEADDAVRFAVIGGEYEGARRWTCRSCVQVRAALPDLAALGSRGQSPPEGAP